MGCPTTSRVLRVVSSACLLLILTTRLAGGSDRPSAPLVAGFERFQFGEHPDASSSDAGLLLLGELNCVACHTPSTANALPVSARQAPDLTGVSSRVIAQFMRRFIADPQAVKPGTTMPAMFSGLPPAERDRRVEAIVHYLASLGPAPQHELPVVGAGQRGSALYHQVGCVACHGPRPVHETGATEIPHAELQGKYTLPSLAALLQDPLHVRPGGRMPDLNLTSDEARDIAAFLLELPEVARLRYQYYEGNWNALPDFSQLQPVAEGAADDIDVALARRREQFGLRFEGYLRIAAAGEYTFHLSSDDGSRLLIDGQQVLNNDGIHALTTERTSWRLEPGMRQVVVEYFEQGGEERLTVEFEGPGISRRPLAEGLAADRETPELPVNPEPLTVRPALASEGRRWFREVGCAACHVVEESGQRVVTALSTKALDALHTDRGCLADSERGSVPDYQFTSDQRVALRAALEELPRTGTLPPQQIVSLTLRAMNCLACHQRDEVGGVQQAHDRWFQTTIPEMGDEGRIPPQLTGVGGKLTSRWLSQLLAEGAKDRPYMLTRMPKFGHANVGHLTPLLESLDHLPPVEPPQFDQSSAEVKEIGRTLAGEAGLSCIKCHTFGPYRSQGIQSIDMRLISERLREEWFRPYLRDPQRFRPGTRMPAAWPPTGPSLFNEFFAGDSDRQIAAVWQYLSDGQRAKIPAGLITPSMELVPVDRAIIYRNFISGAGPRAIAVGYPEGVHQAFDANHLRVALLWKGRFLDASRHWSGRGEGFQGPLSDSILSLLDGPPLAVLADPAQSWPAESSRQMGYRFRGYRLDPAGRPTFQYEAAGLSVDDQLDTADLGPTDPIARHLHFSPPQMQQQVYFRAAVGQRIEAADDRWYNIDGTWRLRVESPSSPPLLRVSDGRSELLVPVGLTGEAMKLGLYYAW